MKATFERDDKGYWLVVGRGKQVAKHGPFTTPSAMRAWETLNLQGVEDDSSDKDTKRESPNGTNRGKRRDVLSDNSVE